MTTIIALTICLVLLGLSLVLVYGPRRAVLVTLARAAWLVPLVLTFFPADHYVEIPTSPKQDSIQVFVDDSDSMKSKNGALNFAERMIARMTSSCVDLGCTLRVAKLSELSDLTAQGESPLSEVLTGWFEENHAQPWVVFSDGGDRMPDEPWPQAMAHAGGRKSRQGLIVHPVSPDEENNWIERIDFPQLAFSDKPIQGTVQIRRLNGARRSSTQLQVYLGDKMLLAADVLMEADETEQSVGVEIAQLPKGIHQLEIKLVAVRGEQVQWDNSREVMIEVLSDTAGVLHLLGEPSWDGRFLTRFLHGEPKFKLISFFILRDPWDSSFADERDLALIPFPVDQLFTESIDDFKVLILQNFSLLQFLQPAYQKRLVRFVKDGGGLLFFGGPRALQDLASSEAPLRELLPFVMPEQSGVGIPFQAAGDNKPDPNLPWFDADADFQIEFGELTQEQRAIATVIDDWDSIAEPLQGFKSQGLHHLENVTFKKRDLTTLLWAKSKAVPAGRVPLAVASYPGKGRALWFFTDKLWQLAMSPKSQTPRVIYEQLIHSSLTWLLRSELRQPLMVQSFKLRDVGRDVVSWSARLNGAVVPYFNLHQSWQVSVCGQEPSSQDIDVKALSSNDLLLEGVIRERSGAKRCRLSIIGEHPAFGSLQAEAYASKPRIFPDRQMSTSLARLEQLSALTTAELITNPDEAGPVLDRWLVENSSTMGLSAVKRKKRILDYYWLNEHWWVLLLFLFIPIEVIIRRWQQLV